MRGGDLDRSIRIEEKLTTSRNSFGEQVGSWIEFATVWARVMPVRGSERFESKLVNAELDSTFRIRHLAGVIPTMRIVHEAKLYDIHAVMEIGRREGLDLLTSVRLDAENI